jgi:hypothetical protein
MAVTGSDASAAVASSLLIAQLARGLSRRDSNRRWLIPLAVFLCLTGLLLILATSVEALAPFIYSIF